MILPHTLNEPPRRSHQTKNKRNCDVNQFLCVWNEMRKPPFWCGGLDSAPLYPKPNPEPSSLLLSSLLRVSQFFSANFPWSAVMFALTHDSVAAAVATDVNSGLRARTINTSECHEILFRHLHDDDGAQANQLMMVMRWWRINYNEMLIGSYFIRCIEIRKVHAFSRIFLSISHLIQFNLIPKGGKALCFRHPSSTQNETLFDPLRHNWMWKALAALFTHSSVCECEVDARIHRSSSANEKSPKMCSPAIILWQSAGVAKICFEFNFLRRPNKQRNIRNHFDFSFRRYPGHWFTMWVSWDT